MNDLLSINCTKCLKNIKWLILLDPPPHELDNMYGYALLLIIQENTTGLKLLYGVERQYCPGGFVPSINAMTVGEFQSEAAKIQ